MSIESKIKDLKIILPEPKDPVGSYVASKLVGKLLYISGQISTDENGDLIKGKIGKDLDVKQGYEAAKDVVWLLSLKLKRLVEEIFKKLNLA